LKLSLKKRPKALKPAQDLNDFSRMLKKITVEAAFNAEMEEHLGYEKHARSVVKNNRNGITTKRRKTKDGEFDLDTPRDRDGSLEPRLVKKNQSRLTSMDEKVLWLYAQDMST
jgi:transposase-like protein